MMMRCGINSMPIAQKNRLGHLQEVQYKIIKKIGQVKRIDLEGIFQKMCVLTKILFLN